MKVIVKETGVTLTERMDTLKRFPKVAVEISNDVGQRATTEMQNYINNKRVRPGTGRFASTIKFYPLPDGWGIGNVSDIESVMGRNVWAVINWGSGANHPAAGRWVAFGAFKPGKEMPSSNPADFRTGRWTEGAGSYRFKPMKPIPPMHYIEYTFSWITTAFNNYFAIIGQAL